MSAPNEWPGMDGHSMSLPTIVSSTDLFDGDLFGDELIDIYNSTVDATADESHGLLAPPSASAKKEDGNEEMLGAMGDGLGAFRPSTSFNDLSTLLVSGEGGATTTTTATATATETKAPATEQPVTPTSSAGDKKPSKKRPSPAAAVAPSPKRKPTAARRVSAVHCRKEPTEVAKPVTTAAAAPKAASKAKGKAGDKANTPNPLTTAASAVAPAVAAATAAAAAARPKPSPAVTTSQPVVKATTAVAPTATATAAVVSKPPDASDFKSIAQAAVSSLILSAGNGETAPAVTDGVKPKVDTSTAHIKALTGNNWVAACAGATQGIVSVPSVADSKANNRARRQNLTPDERARQNRDRNREHARNTRLRKKAYVEELKRTLTELVNQRDAAELEKRQAAQRELEQREVRFRVIEEFLKLRGRNETNFARWAAILEDGFTLTVPTSDFRGLMKGEVVPGYEQTLGGVSDAMADASIFSGFLQTLGDGAGTVTSQYQCDRKNFFMDGCQAVLEWTASSVGTVKKGAPSELTLKGSLRGKFSPASNKLLSARMTIDTGAVLVQLQKITASQVAVQPDAVADAAQAAASQADAILDSLQMPCLPSAVPAAVIVHPSSSSSEASSEKGEQLDDDSEVGDKVMAGNGPLPKGATSVTA